MDGLISKDDCFRAGNRYLRIAFHMGIIVGMVIMGFVGLIGFLVYAG